LIWRISAAAQQLQKPTAGLMVVSLGSANAMIDGLSASLALQTFKFQLLVEQQ